MTKTRGAFRLFALAVLATASVQVAEASATEPDRAAGHEVRVTNNYAGVVNVYVKGADGRTHDLGRVARDGRATLEIPGAVAAAGPFQLQVVPRAPSWAPWSSTAGIRTHALDLPEGVAVSLWLAADLKDAKVEVPRG